MQYKSLKPLLVTPAIIMTGITANKKKIMIRFISNFLFGIAFHTLSVDFSGNSVGEIVCRN